MCFDLRGPSLWRVAIIYALAWLNRQPNVETMKPALTIFFISSSGSNTVKKGTMLNRKGSTRVCRRWMIFAKKRERTWKHASCGRVKLGSEVRHNGLTTCIVRANKTKCDVVTRAKASIADKCAIETAACSLSRDRSLGLKV